MPLINKEVSYTDIIERIEHITGKNVKSYKKDYARGGTWILFDDNTCLFNSEGEMLNLSFQEIPESFCASCGEERHAGFFDCRGWCSVVAKNFWEKVRKLYWHRYSQNKNEN